MTSGVFAVTTTTKRVQQLASRTLLQLREMARSLGLRRDASLSPALTGESQPGVAVAQSEVRTRVVLMPRDPQWGDVFWEISAGDRHTAAAAGAQQLCLRVADVTGLPQGAHHLHTLQEVVVDAQGCEWHLAMPLADRDYRVELGYRLHGGGWLSLALSAVARVPADQPSTVVADRFTTFSLDETSLVPTQAGPSGGVEHELLYQFATAGSARSRRVGSEVLHEQDFNGDQADRRSLSASGAGLWASGRHDSGSGLLRERAFWLVADAELIVYGATEPTATLFIGDRQIPLAADGTFRVQVPFRDGQQLYPIRAIAADGEQQRSIRLEFERCTPQARVNPREAAVAEWF